MMSETIATLHIRVFFFKPMYPLSVIEEANLSY